MCNYMLRIIAYAVAGRKVTSIQYFGKRFFRQSVLCNAIIKLPVTFQNV